MVSDPFRLKVGDLFSRRAIQRLKPEVPDIAFTYGINYSLAVMGEADFLSGWPLEIQQLYSFTRVTSTIAK